MSRPHHAARLPEGNRPGDGFVWLGVNLKGSERVTRGSIPPDGWTGLEEEGDV